MVRANAVEDADLPLGHGRQLVMMAGLGRAATGTTVEPQQMGGGEILIVEGEAVQGGG